MSIQIRNAENPGWVTSPDTSSIAIRTTNTYNGANCTIDIVDTGMSFTPSLVPGTLTNVVITKDLATNKVAQTTNYTFGF